MDNLIMGLDVSTSCVGISIFNEGGELLELTHANPQHNYDTLNQMEDLHYKSTMLREFFIEKKWHVNNIKKIIIEEPLMAAKGTAHVAAMLNQFHGLFYNKLKELFYDNVKIFYINEYDARLNAFPQLSEYVPKMKKRVLWRPIPKKINGKPIKEYRKMLILLLVAQTFPEISWQLNNNKTINKKNYDRADSIATVLGFMHQNKLWTSNSLDLDNALEFIHKYFDYLKWEKTIKGSSIEKKSLKCHYLTDVLKIKNYINIDVFN